jgi:hypothetical protein
MIQRFHGEQIQEATVDLSLDMPTLKNMWLFLDP